MTNFQLYYLLNVIVLKNILKKRTFVWVNDFIQNNRNVRSLTEPKESSGLNTLTSQSTVMNEVTTPLYTVS